MSVLSGLGSSSLNLLLQTPYFKGKGHIALWILRVCKSVLPLQTRTPNGARVWLGDDDAGQLLLPYLIKKYESELFYTLLHYLAHLKPGGCFADIGANVGFYSMSAAHYLRNTSAITVHAFEPNPRAVNYLRRNAALNHVENVLINREAVGNQTGKISLYTSPATITIGSLRQVGSDLTEVIEVRVITLDAYFAKPSAPRLGLLKLDIEGGEFLALQGARAMLERDHPVIIYEEFEGFCKSFGYMPCDTRAYLQELGYRLFVIRPRWPHGARWEPTSDKEAGRYRDTQNILAVPANSSTRLTTDIS
jgi:FkbM family methyltransferase